MAHRTPKINDTVKFTDQQQAILNDAAEQLMEAGGLTALTQAHFNEAMKIVAQRFINAALQGELEHHLTREYENLNEEESAAERVENKRNGHSKKTLHGNKGDLEIQIPRDRKGTYVPRLVPKHSRHFNDSSIYMDADCLPVKSLSSSEVIVQNLFSFSRQAPFHRFRTRKQRLRPATAKLV